MFTSHATTTRPEIASSRESGRSRREFALPLLLGPLRGYWWQPGCGGKIARILLGTYEPEQSALFRTHLRAGQTVLDVGAATGYYTLLAARLVGAAGRVVAFEPDLRNLRHLQSHVVRNALGQVEVVQHAIADCEGRAQFGGGTGTGTGRLCDGGSSEVAVRRLDDVALEMRLVPQHIKIDVEGAEAAVLDGGEQLIKTHRPRIFLSTHDWIRPGVHSRCCDVLTSWGYRLVPITGRSVATATEIMCEAN